MRPSDVNLAATMPPLVGTCGSAEAECLATLITAALAANGDVWRPIQWSEVRENFIRLVTLGVEPWVSLSKNPFWRPDADRLFAEQRDRQSGITYYIAIEGEDGSMEFTFAGLLALSKHRKAE